MGSPYLNYRAGSISGVSSVTQGAITVNFSSPTQVVQNFLGDYFIKTPVTVSSVSPSPTGTGTSKRNGAMVNPTTKTKQGFDGRFSPSTSGGGYDETVTVTFPRAMSAGESLICSVSKSPELDYAALLSAQGSNLRGTDYMETFTFVDTLPTINTFRPARCGTTKTLYTTSDINFGLLPGLTAPSDPETGGSNAFQLSTSIKGSPHLWHNWYAGIDVINDLSSIIPDQQQEWYKGLMCMYMNRLAIYTMCNFSDVQTYAKRIIQNGIDLRGVADDFTDTPAGWWAFGAGFGGANALPLLYAGWLLEDSSFTSIVSDNPEWFSHDYQFYYSTTPYSGYSAGYTAAGLSGPNYPLFGDNRDPLVYGSNHSTRDSHGIFNACNGVDSTGYDSTTSTRYHSTNGTCTHMSNAGTYMTQNALKAYAGARLWSHLANQDANWGATAWMDFVDWQTVDYANLFGSSQVTNGDVYIWGGTGNNFMFNMWDTYR